MKRIDIKYYFSVLILLLGLTSCKKVIDLDLGNHTGELVIEGNITDQDGPQLVKLSRNVPFTNTNTYPTVSGATVTIDDDLGHHFQLAEDPLGTYSVNGLKGYAGGKYTLTVAADGKTYTAHSSMPQVIALDSITSKNDIFESSKGKKMITVYFQDTPDTVNQYRFVMYVNNIQVKSIFAFNDEFIDGKYVTLDLQQNDVDIYAGDTVTVEMQCIDKPIYTYWFTLMQQQANNPGGAVAPANPPTNISPVTLGYFSAHSTQSKTITVK